MGEATTGRTLTAELCFKLFLELKRGKRLFLMLGFLPSSMSVCGAEYTEFSQEVKILIQFCQRVPGNHTFHTGKSPKIGLLTEARLDTLQKAGY